MELLRREIMESLNVNNLYNWWIIGGDGTAFDELPTPSPENISGKAQWTSRRGFNRDLVHSILSNKSVRASQIVLRDDGDSHSWSCLLESTVLICLLAQTEEHFYSRSVLMLRIIRVTSPTHVWARGVKGCFQPFASFAIRKWYHVSREIVSGRLHVNTNNDESSTKSGSTHKSTGKHSEEKQTRRNRYVFWLTSWHRRRRNLI